MNKEKEICLASEKYVICHWCERTNMATKCKVFMKCSWTFMVVKHIWLSEKEHLRDHSCVGTDVAYKCRTFVAIA